MSYVLFDNEDGTYLTTQYLDDGRDDELWSTDADLALRFETVADVEEAIEDCDGDHWLRDRFAVLPIGAVKP